MSQLPFLPVAFYSAVVGLLSHVGWFIRGEHDLMSRQYMAAWAALQAAAFFALTRIAGESYATAVVLQTLASSAFLGALFTSIVVYRLFFHQLRKYPGPLAWRISKFGQMKANLDAKGYLHLDELHKRYGKYVRIGPTELSINDPVAVPLVLGPGSKCVKAAWYDAGAPLLSLHQCRDTKLHERRRRVWDRGFNAKALRNYESRVSSYTDLLVEKLKAAGGKAINAPKWFNYYSFDVMGDLSFGESFHMLESGEKHFAIDLLEAGISFMNIIPVIPWLFYALSAIPGAAPEYHAFIKYCDEQAEKRKKMKPSEPDVMSHLLDAEPMSSDEAVNRNWQQGDSRLIIVAGSDTTAATLSFCVYELLKHPAALKKLRQEVGSCVYDYQGLAKSAFLNAVIDEALRLHPAVPAGLIRIAPPEGITIKEWFIPGGTVMTLPTYTIQRSPEAFVKPDEFIPERWTDKPEMIKNQSAWAPFSMGPMGCIGKQLAYMEIRAVLARLVTTFDIQFADGEDGSGLIHETKDYFTLNLADMEIVLKPRDDSI